MSNGGSSAGQGRSSLERWSLLGGAVYVVLFVIGVLTVDGGAPDFEAPPDKVTAYWSDGGHRDKAAVGFLLVVVGVFFLVWFLAALRERTRRLEREGGLLTTIVTIGGAAYVATTLAGIGLEVGILTMSGDTYQGQVYPDLIHAARDAGYTMHAAGGAAIGAVIVAFSAAALRARSVAVWAGWLGVVAGVVAIFSVFFFPLFVIALWLFIVSVGLFLWKEDGSSPA